ncbi:sodium:solute symporter family protein [Polystyrenella longa]|nr:sodium:solute symporter family protein [Polystyrenella longa]
MFLFAQQENLTKTAQEVAQSGWLGLGVADWCVLAVYFVVILVVGLWSMTKVSDISDFFMGGRRFGKVFMMFFAFGSGTSSEQAISVVAGTWRAGLAGIWWQFLWLWATPFYWLVAPVMRRMRALTTADFFEHRFNTPTATLYTIYGIIMAIVFIAAGLFSSGKMVDALTGGELEVLAQQLDVQVPTAEYSEDDSFVGMTTRPLKGYEYAILAMTTLFVIYGMAGGLGAAIITDFIQGILTIIFSFLLLPFVFNMVGGFGALQAGSQIKSGMLNLAADPAVAESLGKEPITYFYVCMLAITAMAGIVVQPHIMGVCGAGKTEFEGRFGFTVGNFLKRICTIAWTFTGLACILWYLGDNSPLQQTDPDLYRDVQVRNNPEEYNSLPPAEQERIDKADKDFSDSLFGRAAFEILPTISPGLIGLLLASLLAAVMSTSDAQMVIGSGLFTENIYKKFIAKNRSDKHYLWVGRIAGLLIVMLALILQTSFEDVIHALQVIIKTPAAIGISFWFGIAWRRWNALAVWASTFAAVGTWWFVSNMGGSLSSILPESMFKNDGKSMYDVYQMLFYMGVGTSVGIAVSLLTPRMPQEKLDKFFRLIHTPITPGEYVAEPCTLPANPAPQEHTLFKHPDIELPRLTLTDISGFLLAWAAVATLIGVTVWLSNHA